MQVTFMIENYDDYYRKTKSENDEYLKTLPQGEKDESEILSILAYRGELYYDSLKRIRKLKDKLGHRKSYHEYYRVV